MGLGSGIRKNVFRILDTGLSKAPDLCYRIRIRNTAYNAGDEYGEPTLNPIL
jgi:hypothetical protein